MEEAALSISIVSIVASILMTFWQIEISKRVNRININKSIFDQIFDRYLIDEIPKNRRFLKFDKTNKLTGVKNIQETLHNLRKDSIYFHYRDKTFYDKIEGKILEIEDYLVNCTNDIYIGSEQSEVLNKTDALIGDLYKIIEDKKVKGK